MTKHTKSREVKDKDFHYTKEKMVADLLNILKPTGSVLDAGSGKNKVWYNNLKGEKYECEIDDGCDFYKWEKNVDWVVGNPPYHESWKFTEKALEISRKGVAWLVNTQALNSHLTPRRLDNMKKMGFVCTNIHIVNDKRWFGRYFFIIFQKDSKSILSWNTKVY